MNRIGSVLTLMLLAAGSIRGQSSVSLKGQMFADYYYVVSNHLKGLEDQNGFWFRRIYFTCDQKLENNFDVRFRLEMHSPGDFTSNSKLVPFVKDAYLRWCFGEHELIFGLSQAPTFAVVEKVWGYRSVERVPGNLQGYASTRDTGVALKGRVASGRMGYHLMLGNGSGTRSEINRGKKAMFALNGRLAGNLLLEGYVDYEARPGLRDRSSTHFLVAYVAENLRAAVQYFRQRRQRSEPSGMLELRIFSAFGAGRVLPKTWVFARVDRLLDPNPDAAKIAYLPLDPAAKATFVAAGIDFRPTEDVRLIPNVELVRYDEADRVSPARNDIILRMTVHYLWR